MSILFKSKPIVINADLAKAIGLNEAIILQQLNYWITETGSGVTHGGRRWVYNTYEDWQEQFPFWSPDTIKRGITSLKKKGLITVEQLNKAKHDRTNFYTINYNKIMELDDPVRQVQGAPIEEGKMPSSTGAECPDLTETTTEITTETKTHGASDDDAVRDGQASGIAKPFRKRAIYPDDFEELWAAYPKRAGHDPKKPAFQAWTARQRDDGVSHEDMMAGVQRYAAYCRAEGMVNTRFVKQAQFFLGPNHPFADEWSPSQNRRPSMKSSFEDANYSGYDTATPDWLGGDND